jgi:hypothetical protein
MATRELKMPVLHCAKVFVVAAILCLTLEPSAHAWGPQGHALIGKIADQLLAGTKAGKKVNQILRTYTLTEAAKWPDCVRSVHKQASGAFKFVPDKYTGSCTAFETPAEEKRMEDYAKRNWDTFPYEPGHGNHEAYHFADIPIQDLKYADGEIGANDHDVVHAIDAAIAKLKGEPVPAPFSIKDDKEAILMLAHFVGDLHQPLHVGAIYLTPDGQQVNPAAAADAETESTRGGNEIHFGKSSNLHAEWDGILKSIQTPKAEQALLAIARQLTPTDGPIEQWAAKWASESVVDANAALSGLSFGQEGPDHVWQATFADRTRYLSDEHLTQRERIIDAGARLAAIFQEIWP